MESLSSKKITLRQKLKEQRHRIAPDMAQTASATIAAHFLTEPRLTGQPAIAGYLPVKSELDITPLLSTLAERGVKTGLPVPDPETKTLSFRRWKPGNPLIPGPYNIEIPAETRPFTPTLILLPLLAFDHNGHRLGYGGGYYDRTLAALRATPTPPLAVGVAYACQEISTLPHEPFDQPLDAVLTEKELRFFA